MTFWLQWGQRHWQKQKEWFSKKYNSINSGQPSYDCPCVQLFSSQLNCKPLCVSHLPAHTWTALSGLHCFFCFFFATQSTVNILCKVLSEHPVCYDISVIRFLQWANAYWSSQSQRFRAVRPCGQGSVVLTCYKRFPPGKLPCVQGGAKEELQLFVWKNRIINK